MLYSYEHIPGQTQACPVGSNKNDLLPNFLLFWFVFNGAGCIERIKERCSFALINICGVNPLSAFRLKQEIQPGCTLARGLLDALKI